MASKKQVSGAGTNAPNKHWQWAAAIILVSLACFDMIEPIASIPFHVARNINEGWNAYWAITAASGGHLYPPMDALISNTYPPLSFYLLGFLGRAPVDPILAGRAVALISLLVVAINIIIWLRANGVRSSLATLSGAAFIVTVDALAHGYIAMNDPQWLAHALMTTGLVIMWRNPRSPSGLTSAAVLIVLGGWVKQLLIPLPAALAAWLFETDRRVFWRWVGLLCGLGALTFGLAVACYGHVVLNAILFTPRHIIIKRTFIVAYAALPPLFPFLWFTLMLLRQFRSSSTARFILIYFATSAAVGALACAGEGVWVNAIFDVAIAGAFATGVFLEDMTTTLSNSRAAHPFLLGAGLVPALILILWTPTALRLNIGRLQSLPARIEAANEDIQFIRQHGAFGAACESLALCFWAGAPFNLDYFNFGQKLKTGRLSMSLCSRLFGATKYTIIHLYTAPTDSDPMQLLPRECNVAIADHYEIVRHSINGYFLIARHSPSVT